jgi:spermidine/putrescine-binding protein
MNKQGDTGNSERRANPLRAAVPLTRRRVLMGMGALGGLTTLSLPVGRAHASTTINWIGWEGFDMFYNVEDYLDRNDITFQATYISSNEETITKLQAGGLGQIDFNSLDAAYSELANESGLIQPIDVSRIPNFEKLIPQFRDSEALTFDGKQWGIPYNWGFYPMNYDPEKVTEVPTSWFDILKPEYKGKVVMINDPLANYIVWGSVAGGAEHSTLMTHEQLKKTIDFLIDVKKNHARTLAESYAEAADIFARGEAVIAALGWDAVTAMAEEKGKKLGAVVPKEGTGAYLEVVVIPMESPNLDVTYGLINHAISDEAQKYFGESFQIGICNLDVVPMLPEFLQERYHYADLDAFTEKVEIWKMPPLETHATLATFDDLLEEYERFLKA